MNTHCKFAPVVFDDSIQHTQIANLKNWVKRVFKRKPRDPLSRGIAKLIDLGLLRYGVWPASFGQKRAFAAVWRSPEVQRFIRDEIYPKRLHAGLLLDLFAEGRLLMDLGYRDGNPEFIFYGADTAQTKAN